MEDEEDCCEEGSKSGEMSGDSLVINEDVEEDNNNHHEEEEDTSAAAKSPVDSSGQEEEAEVMQPEESSITPVLPVPLAVSTPARKITTLNVPSVTVSSHMHHAPAPNIPALPPGTIAKPVLDPSIPEGTPEDGHDPTVRKLIIMAIDVMKNRKARPDGKRISNWINRRYGRPVISINEELEKMVIGGELTRVDYKGSASYRITTAEAKSARRRRRLQKNNNSNNSSSNNSNLPSNPSGNNPQGGLIVEPILRQPNLSHKPPMQHQHQPPIVSVSQAMHSLPPPGQFPAQIVHSPQILSAGGGKLPPLPGPPQHLFHPPGPPLTHYHHQLHPPPPKFIAPQEITLRTLVCDYMADLSSSGIHVGEEIDIKFIGRSVDVSRRPINRGAVLANLENILEKEIQAGHFVKTGEELYAMQPPLGYVPTSSLPLFLSPTNTIINPAPMPPPPSAGPPPFLSTSSAPPPPQIVNVGTLSGPNLSEYMYNGVSAAAAIPLTVTSSSGGAHHRNNGLHPPSTLASATPPLPNFTKMTFISSGMPKNTTSTNSHMMETNSRSVVSSPLVETPPAHAPAASAGESKSDEERKNDLIQEKLFKMNKSLERHSPGRKSNMMSASSKAVHSAPPSNNNNTNGAPVESSTNTSSGEPLYMLLREKRLNGCGGNLLLESVAPTQNANSSSTSITQAVSAPPRRGVGRPKKTTPKSLPPSKPESKRRRKEQPVVEEDVEDEGDEDGYDDEDDEESVPQEEWKNKNAPSVAKSGSSEAAGIGGNTRSSRKKKSRKIFDPADHETPSRKRKIASPTPSVDEDFVGGVKEDTCLCCEGGPLKNKKGKPENLLKCKDCRNIVHPSCLDYTEDLCKKIEEAASWQCINCKACAVCESNKEDQLLVFCDGCDLAFHRECHSPKVPSSKGGSWECAGCRKSKSMNGHAASDLPMEPLAEMKQRENSSSQEGFLRHNSQQQPSRLLPPNLPPHLHPHTGNIPENWEDYLPDPDIPDVSYWDAKQVEEHFLRMGFSQDQSAVFRQQEIDGKSLLLLQRSDVTSSLGLKLGPALKMFNHIKKLQTRRHFPG